MRVLLFTGKGGVGKTTCAAATAAHAAATGCKTLVVSSDSSRSLSDVCGVALGPQPAEMAAGLYGAQMDTQRAFERSWGEVASYLQSVLETAGSEPLHEAEIAVLPGADEVLALLEVQSQAASGRWDAVVVDCGPTAQTLRMLALPAALTWYFERLLPLPRKGLRTMAPALTRAAGTVVPRARVFDAIVRLHARLRAVRDLLGDASTTSVRLVLTPESVVVADARRTFTALSLHGYSVDAVIVNRVMGPGEDGCDAGRAEVQRRQLARIEESFAPLRISRVPYFAAEPVGVEALGEVAREVYAGDDPLAVRATGPAVQLDRGETRFVLSLALPLAERGEVDLVRRRDELVVTVQGQRRVLTLPSALRRCVVTGAALADGRLAVDFEPDPVLWLRS